jgi:hypothetical protein
MAEKHMRPIKKTAYTAGVLAIPILVSAWLVATWLLANRVPSRPKGVGQNAVFVWSPAVGFPRGLPRRGSWLDCREKAGRDRCKLSDMSGRTEYESEFVRSGDRGAIIGNELQIDSSKSAQEKVWVGNVLIPLACLKNGEVLIPASRIRRKGSFAERI